jgi:putative acetyltransferase
VVSIRPATDADREAILAVVRAAFSGDGRDGSEEVSIVEGTWARGAAFELVAVDDDGRLVGHVQAAEGDLDGRGVVGVAPLGVAPDRQRSGVGSALMRELLERAEAAGLPMLVLLGDPGYYARFGFEPSGPLGIFYPPAGEGSPHFQVHRLSAHDPGLRGRYTYRWERPAG